MHSHHCIMLVFASELAAVIGRNKYKCAAEAFEALWQRMAPEQYHDCVLKDVRDDRQAQRQLAPAVMSAISTLTQAAATDTADVMQLAQQAEERVKAAVAEKLVDAGVPAEKVEAVQQCVSATQVHHILQQCAPEVKTQAAALLEASVSLQKEAQSEVKCAFGTAREEASRQQMETDGVARAVVKDNAFKVMWMPAPLSFSGKRWGVGGRLDGLDDQGRVVEIKNRTRHFFARIPDYEWVQVQAYLQLTKAREAVFVQQLHGQQRVSTVARDDAEWSGRIMPRLTSVLEVLDEFMAPACEYLRDEWVTASTPEREVLLEQWIRAADQRLPAAAR